MERYWRCGNRGESACETGGVAELRPALLGRDAACRGRDVFFVLLDGGIGIFVIIINLSLSCSRLGNQAGEQCGRILSKTIPKRYDFGVMLEVYDFL